INNESFLYLNTEHTSFPSWVIENTENDEISSDIDDSENDRSEFIYNMHDLKEAVSFKFRNEEIDDLVKFSIKIKIEEDL
ncbi:16617_t:CDS:2, partial [Racocetra persica]